MDLNENQTCVDIMIPNGTVLMPYTSWNHFRLYFAKADARKVCDWLHSLTLQIDNLAHEEDQKQVKSEKEKQLEVQKNCKHENGFYGDREYGTTFCVNCHSKIEVNKNG